MDLSFGPTLANRVIFLQMLRISQRDRAYCEVHGKSCSLPKVDILISGPACTSISGERISNAEFATCYKTGAGASGLTHRRGYRDLISKRQPFVTFYENVKTVAERILTEKQTDISTAQVAPFSPEGPKPRFPK